MQSGMMEVLEDCICAVLKNAVEKQAFPGAAVGIVTRSGTRRHICAGTHAREGISTVSPDSVYDVASITKAIPTSTLALKAVEDGRASLDERLCDRVPEFRNNYSSEVTLFHLLTQTLDFGYSLSAHRHRPPEELLNVVLTHEQRSRPGTRFGYCNATSILLGLFVERVYDARLDCLARDMLFSPLAMSRTSLGAPAVGTDETVPTENDQWRGGVVRGEVHDESAWVLSRIMTPGSAGLFTTVNDLLNFLQMLLCEGEFEGRRILSPSTITSLHRNRLEHIGRWAALGWELNQLRFMGLRCSTRTIGKTGFTGCMVMCDFEKHTGLVFLSNHTFPRRRPDADTINAIRREIADIVFSD